MIFRGGPQRLEKIDSERALVGQHPDTRQHTTSLHTTSLLTIKMTDMIQISRAELSRIHALLGAHLGEEAVAALSKTSKKSAPVADKKPRANAGQPTAHGAYTALVLAQHDKNSAEFKAFVAKRVAAAEAGEMVYTADQGKVKSGKKAVGDLMDAKEAVAGAHIPFVAEWKRDHQAEWLAFKAQFEADHPKGSAAASVADDASVAESAEPKAKKSRKPMTEEAKAAAAAKRAAKKAAKAAAAPADAAPAAVDDAAVEEAAVDLSEEAPAAEEAEEAEDEFLPFSIGKASYMRFGHINAEEETVWHEGGHLWLAVDGARGAYAGKVDAKGKLDKSEAAMNDEPELE